MYRNHKVVVTMTSWRKRIGNCADVIRMVLDNSVKPDIVFLNLSEAEFPNREGELPVSLVQLSKDNPTFKINWVPGPNTKTMKKVFPILTYLDDDDIIIDIDDDLLLPKDFVEVRLGEFIEHGMMFPITGGNNPKWHLNLGLYGSFYNSLAPASIFQKKMLAGYEQVLVDEVVNTYNDDTLYTMLCIVNGYWPIPTTKLSTFYGMGPRKIGLFHDICGLRKARGWKSDAETIRAFIQAFNSSSDISFGDSMFNVVIFDSLTVAGDNGEHFYRVAREKYPWMKMTFVLSKNCSDWKRLEADGFNLYPFEGKDLETLMKNATYILWSKDTSKSRILRKYRDKSIFVSHGTTSLMYDVSFYLGGAVRRLAKYVCVNSQHEADVVRAYSNRGVLPIITGFPRHDTLLRKSEANKKLNKPKQVLLSFHYRGGSMDISRADFESSQYLSSINSLLNSQQLKDLVDQGTRVVFIPHARCMKYLDLFKIPSHVVCGVDKPFQDVFAESDILVTDFSSTSFEFAYMDKPTLVYIPDKNYVKNHLKNYKMENISKYSHLTMCNTNAQFFDELNKLVKGDGKCDFSHKTFEYVDTDNTKRLVEWMLNKRHDVLKQPATNNKKSQQENSQPTTTLPKEKWKFSEFMGG